MLTKHCTVEQRKQQFLKTMINNNKKRTSTRTRIIHTPRRVGTWPCVSSWKYSSTTASKSEMSKPQSWHPCHLSIIAKQKTAFRYVFSSMSWTRYFERISPSHSVPAELFRENQHNFRMVSRNTPVKQNNSRIPVILKTVAAEGTRQLLIFRPTKKSNKNLIWVL